MLKNEVVRLAAILFIICAVVTAVLAVANGITAPIIEDLEQKTVAQAQQEVLPSADSFEDLNYQSGMVTSVARAQNGSGYCVGVSSPGYGGDIKLMVGVGTDGVVQGVKIIELSETPGLGSKATEPAFIGQFAGKGGNLEVVKGAGAEGKISAISGATISSRAVTTGVNEAIKAVRDIMGQGVAQ